MLNFGDGLLTKAQQFLTPANRNLSVIINFIHDPEVNIISGKASKASKMRVLQATTELGSLWGTLSRGNFWRQNPLIKAFRF